ncbi:integrase, catalytic region, zinc finger, CCHC-type containing protein [Tanacetum coccineum]
MSENEDSYHDTVLDLEAKLKKNVDLILKLGTRNVYAWTKAIVCNSEISLNVRDTEDTLDDASKSQQKVYEKINDPIAVANKQNCWTIDYEQINALYKDFVPQKELSVKQKYFPSSFIPSEKTSNATPSIPTSMPNQVKPIANELQFYFEFFRTLFQKDIKEMKDVFESTESELYNSLHAEIEQIKKKSIEIQEGLQARIKILEIDVQRCEKQSVDFELKLQHEKEKHKWDSILKNKNTNPLDYSWISKMEKIEDENVSLDFKVQSLIKERMNAASSVRRPMNRDSHVKNSILANSKKSTKKVTVYVRKNKQTDNTSENVISNKENVINVDVANASQAKTLLCVSCMQNVVQIVLWIVDSGCSKHMTGDRSLLRNFIEKFMGTVRFGNDNFVAITGYGDYIQGNITICHVYYVEGLGHNLFSVGQFCDGDLEVAFRSKTCYVRNLEGDDLLTGRRESSLYTISNSDMAASSPVCLMSKATSTKSWLWHHRPSHLNSGIINDLTRLDLVDGISKFKYEKDHLCFAYETGKSKKSSHPPKLVPSNHSKLELLYMDLCGPIRVASINGKKYIIVIVDDYSQYTWVYFLHSKDETPKIIKKFIA